MAKIIHSYLPCTVKKRKLDPQNCKLIALYSSFFILDVVCGSLIDHNSQNISVISSLKVIFVRSY